MGRVVLQACLPWLALLLVSLVCACGLVRINRYRPQWHRLRELHRDQVGGVQSLSFVLTLPLFVMVMLLIVQVSQLMIATVVVHYAAYGAARSAVVWIPADLGEPEGPNCISICYPDPDAEEQMVPILDPTDPNYGPAEGGMTYVVEPGSLKYDRISTAAVIGCLAISPSRDVGATMPGGGENIYAAMYAVYGSMIAGLPSENNPRIPGRLRNKLAYAMENTEVEVRFFHKNSEPPLLTYLQAYDIGQFHFNELGWQDVIKVTVRHDLALLPGPGRLLARPVASPDGSTDRVSSNIRTFGKTYVYPLHASITMGTEGEIPVIPYVHY